MTAFKILIVEDDPLLGDSLQEALQRVGYRVRLARSGLAALEAVTEESYDLLLQDVRLPDSDGLEVLREVLARQPQCMAVVMTAHGTIDTAVEAMRRGAFDFITKPFQVDVLFMKLQRMLEFTSRGRVAASGDDLPLSRIIGNSPSICEAKKTAVAVAPTDSTVLLLGETGTGKELLAEAIHALSPRRKGPFVSVNCASIPQNLLESEFFGVERGAYTDASRSRGGYLEAAAGGTVFLDEVAELPLNLQGKLLRVIEQRKVFRVGGTSERSLDFRLICATCADIDSLVQRKLFREDLFYRINVVRITVPALRERREDIPLLISFFLKTLDAGRGRKRIRFSGEALESLSLYNYPGNIRELRNIIERLTILHGGENIHSCDLPPEISLATPYLGKQLEEYVVGRPLKEALAEFERRYIEKVLDGVKGRKTLSAKILGLSRKVLWEKLKKNDDGGTAA